MELLKDYIAEQCSYDQSANAYQVLAEAYLVRRIDQGVLRSK